VPRIIWIVLWTYVRDGTAWGARDPPAVWYQYSPGRGGEYPRKHLKNYAGTLQVDGYAGFEALFVPPAPNVPANIVEVSCWAHYLHESFSYTRIPDQQSLSGFR